MSITALDIQQQGFEHSLRGYDVEQVDVFLERVAQEVDALVTENEQLKEQLEAAAGQPADPAADERVAAAEAQAHAAAEQARAIAAQAQATEEELAAAKAAVAELQAKLAEKGSMDLTISNAFISAQKAADAMLAEAKVAADNLREEARSEGERIYRESEAKARDFIREALLEKQRIVDETGALANSCDNFRAQYRALLEHFSAEADRMFTDVNPPVVSEASVQAAMPTVADVPAPAEEDAASQAEDELLEDID
ncbi:MAG: DivIVA domain-containing protein [Coriobacteriales bacterium]